MTLVPEQGAIRTWVELYGPLTEARDEAHMAAALALISAAIGWKAWIRWGENAEPCTLNVVLEGRSATSRKTTVANSAHALARLGMEGVDVLARDRLHTRAISHTSNRGLLEIVGAENTEQAARWEAEPPPGHLLVWDEFGSVLGDPDDLKGQGWLGQVRTTLMQLTNGRHGGIATGGSHIPASRCAVSLLSSMTRKELEQRVTTGLLRDGFMGRFLLVPNDGRARILSRPPAWTHAMNEQRESLVGWIRALATNDGRVGDVFDAMTPEAREFRHEWYTTWVEELEATLHEDDSEENAAALEAFGRLQTAALKAAACYAVSCWVPPAPLDRVELDLTAVQWGQDLADICLRNILELARIGSTPRDDTYAARALQALGRAGGELTRKDLLDRVKMNGISREIRWKIVLGLHADGALEVIERRTAGRPATVVVLPPASVNGHPVS